MVAPAEVVEGVRRFRSEPLLLHVVACKLSEPAADGGMMSSRKRRGTSGFEDRDSTGSFLQAAPHCDL